MAENPTQAIKGKETFLGTQKMSSLNAGENSMDDAE